MRSPRTLWRSALAAVAAALIVGCTTGTPQPSPPTASDVDPWSEHGPITLAAAGNTALWGRLVADWNAAHATEPVTLIDLPVSANRRHAQLAERVAADSGEYTLIALDVAWTAEFASKGALVELPATRFDTDALVPAAAASANWNGKLYAYPAFTDAGVLYYRSDLLSEAAAKAPQDWAGLETGCAAVHGHPGVDCLGIGLATDEDLSVAFFEAVQGAGGQVLTATGQPDVNSAAAASGLGWLIDAVDGGVIPEDALGWDAEETAREFATGHLVFQRNWASLWPESTAAGLPTALSELPGRAGVSSAVLGGENLAISAKGRNRGTAADFTTWVGSAQTQLKALGYGTPGPVLNALYSDPELVKAHPQLSVLGRALATATSRPMSVRYGEVTQAIQGEVSAALRGQRSASEALERLQSSLDPLFK